MWEAAKEQLTNSMVHILEHTCIAQLWKMAAPEEGATTCTDATWPLLRSRPNSILHSQTHISEFGTLFFRTASALLESETNLKSTAIKL